MVREVIHGKVTCELRWGSQPCDHLDKCPEQECVLEKDEGLGWRPERDPGEITEAETTEGPRGDYRGGQRGS